MGIEPQPEVPADEQECPPAPEQRPPEIVDPESSEEQAGDEKTPVPDADIDQPVFTLRILVVSTLFTFVWSFVNQIGHYRAVNFSVDTTAAILLSYPVLVAWSKAVPSWKITLFGATLDTNPGPFHLREHLLLSCAMCDAAGTAYVADTLWVMEHDFKRNLGFLGDFLMIVFTKLLGYGLAAVFYRCLIMSSNMPWPGAVYTLEVFRMLHEGAGGRLRIFGAVFLAALAYSWLPDLLWPGLSSLAVLCWFSSSRTVSILGAGTQGFGVLSLNFNLSDVFGYFPFLLFIPAWLGLNAVAGGVFYAWVMSPVLYFTNWESASKIDPMGFDLYTADGKDYPILDLFDQNGQWNQEVYDKHGSPYMSAWFSSGYWFSFVSVTASITHTLCWHWDDCKAAFSKAGLAKVSSFAKRMERLYSPIPPWWGAAYICAIGSGLIATNGVFDVAMPWWSVIVSIVLAALFVVPIGAIQAVTGNQIGLNILAELIGGLMLKHNPVGAILVKVTGYMSMSHALNLVANMKMGQLATVDYKVLFAFQVWGTVVTSLADATAYRVVMDAGLTTGDNPQWNSSSSLKTYKTASYMWGGIGPWDAWMGPKSHYAGVFWSGLLAGAVLPPLFWFLHQRLGWSWCSLVHIPMICLMPGFPATNSWYLLTLGLVLIFQVVLPRCAPQWHEKYNYVTVAGLIAGAGITSFAVAMLSGFADVSLDLPSWMAADSGCTAWSSG